MTDPRLSGTLTHRTTKGALRVQELVATAAEQFLEHGFDAVSVDRLIADVGGSRRNVYGHFGGKEGLFRAAMLHVAAEISKPLEDLKLEGGTVSSVLPAFGRELVLTALSRRTLAVHRILTTEGSRFPDVAQEMLASSYLKILDKLAAWIARHQGGATNQLREDVDARVLAEQFMSLTSSDVKLRAIVGLVTLPITQEHLEQIVYNAVRTFLQGAQPAARTRRQPRK